ncbi:VOC family protein [Brevibacillus migulae]|uniref:VOC family protein n=1 Tax=Brevibacillus migulae TaxID=1644114 RepID=UPI00106F025D|nr:VOC family protein [Brevibacillus migulae]
MALTASNIFVNLPVKDLKKSMEFFSSIGFAFNPQFTDDNAACMVVSENIYVMLLVEPFFQGFSKRQVTDTADSSEVIVALSAESREKVDEIVNKALEAGGKPANEPMDQGGFMYAWSFHDLDGHMWEILYMDPSAVHQ